MAARNRRQKPFYTLDCETDPFDERDVPASEKRIPQPFIWGVYDGQRDEYHELDNIINALAFLHGEARKYGSIIVYAHNGGRFDYHYFRDEINSDEPIMVINGRIAKFRVGEIEFRDSINILPVALKQFEKTHIDYSKMEPDVRHLHMDEIRAYLRSDCVNLWNFISAYFKKLGRNFTQAGGAMKYWSKKYGIKPPQQSVAEFEEYKPFYYGGRVQCFENGHAYKPFKVVDINSAYPEAMLHKHPFSTKAYAQEKLPREKDWHRCFVEIDAIAHGCFPIRNENPGPHHGALYFPDDDVSRRYKITGWELIAALEENACRIVKVHRVHNFPETISFEEYVHEFYAEKAEGKAQGDKAKETIAKLQLNSLYGKFGADPTKYAEWVIATEDTYSDWCSSKLEWDIETKRYELMEAGYLEAGPWGSLHDGTARYLLTRDLPEKKHRYYNVATAASITGFVRAHLYRALRKCSGVIYCDTDSIAAQDISGLPLGSKIGEWKLELDCDEYAVAGKKLYCFRDVDPHLEWTAFSAKERTEAAEKKGLHEGTEGRWYKKACKGADLTPEQIIAVAEGREVHYVPSSPTYSINHPQPIFVPRDIKNTFKDIRYFPDSEIAA